MEILKNPNFDFLGKTRIFVTISLVLIVGGLLNISQWPPFLERYTSGIRYGVEFSGGTQMIVKFRSQPQIDRVREAISSVAPGAVIQSYDQPAKNQVLIRLAGETGIAGSATPVLDALKSGYADNEVATHVVEGGATDAGQLILTFTAK